MLGGCRGTAEVPPTIVPATSPAPPPTPTARAAPTLWVGHEQLQATDFTNVIAYTQMTDTGPEIHGVLLSPDNPAVWGLTETAGAAFLPRWSPNLEYIAYLYYEPQAEAVDFWIVDILADGASRPITSGGVKGVEDFRWSPDGQFLVFHAPQPDGSEQDVYRIDIGSGEIVNLTPESPSWDSDPVWSPDGTAIAFVSDRSTGDGPTLDNIWLMTPDGGNARSLTNSPWEDVLPAWSPDGSQIAFYRWSFANPEEGGPGGLWVANVDGSGERLLQELPGLIAAGLDTPAWSPDGRLIAYQFGPPDDGDIHAVPADGGKSVRIGQPMGHDFAVSWSPDSQLILFCHALPEDLVLYLATPDGATSGSLLGVGGNCYGQWAPAAPTGDAD